jgi:uncharacterized protein involved in outer membrane biogenesis
MRAQAIASAEPRLRSRRLWLGLLVAVVAIAVLWSAAWFYVPPLVADAAEKAVAQALGRRLTLGKVEFNPWTLELTLSDVAVAGASADAAPLLEVKRIHADAALVSLLRLAPVIDAVDIDAPTLRVSRLGDGRYDVDDVLQHLAARPPAGEPAREPARFAVHNIVVHGGAADFVDRPLATTHRVRELELGVPFVSSLPSEREIKVEPHLAFALDGSRFDSAAAATPFAERGNGEVHLRFDGFSVAPWLGHLPRGLPAQLRAATLGADLVVAFEQRPSLSLKVSGTVGADGIEVVDAAAAELLKVGNVKIAIDELRPLERRVRIKSIDVDAAHVVAVRDAAGRVNLLLATEAPAGGASAVARLPLPTSAASAAAASAAANAAAAKTPAPAPWQASVAALSVRAARLDWRDATTSPAAVLALSDFSLAAKSIAWPLDAPVVFSGEGTVGSAADHGKLSFSGQGGGAAATVKVTLAELPMAALRPYLSSVLVPPLAGDLSAEVAIDWQGGKAPVRLAIDAKRVLLTKLVLGEAKAPEIAAEAIELEDVHADMVARSASVGRLALRVPRVRIERDAARRWAFERYGAPGAKAPAAAPRAAPAASAVAGAPAPWQLAVGEFAIERGRVSFSDRLSTPVALDVLDLAVQLRGWALDSKAPASIHLAARVSIPAGPSGKAVGSGVVGSIDARGELKGFEAGQPAGGQLAVLLRDLPMHLLDPYLDEMFSIDVQKAQTSFKGDVRWERPRGAFTSIALKGDATVEDFRATSITTDRTETRSLAMVRDAASARTLLNWKSLSLRGIDLAIAAGQPTRFGVESTALSDFFARVVLDENGRLNIQDVARPGAAASAPPAPASAPRVAASAPLLASAASAAAPASAPSGARPIVTLGPIVVVNGRVVYNDFFVKPNYSANLSELSGRLAGFSSEPPAPGQAPLLADIELRGRVEGTATLDINGKVNPLAKPLALDLKVKVRDLELPPLSPYAIKYAGYGIERGKLSVDLGYVVKPDGQLTASNKIILNQLAFGEKVEGSTANLPVKLAVALLADQHGVIDLDLPVSGSINDPQFSLGGLIWKVITNLIVKAVSAPFNLLASAFGGGGDELSRIEFAPGSAALDETAQANLDKVAKALIDRPALSLTVTGESRLDSENDAWKKERLRQLVRAEKRRQAIAGGADATAAITVSAEEYPALLKEVYRRADIVKPKNVLGLTKDLPPDEMEQLILANMVVADDAMQQLAVRRGVAVRDYLATKDVATSRLFLGAPKVASSDSNWTPRADLKLAGT